MPAAEGHGKAATARLVRINLRMASAFRAGRLGASGAAISLLQKAPRSPLILNTHHSSRKRSHRDWPAGDDHLALVLVWRARLM